MAATAPLIERTDIHKSCKALEAIVNAFNDYCQAAEALAFVEKKLARALKDAVGLKATNELVGNALNAAAILLESLAEVDAKFVKLIDKECEGASNDVKKWFKKLAKEERNHDEKISAANAKIKQAGLAYEKKAKRKDRDVGEEHTRYVNMLSTVGPEMSQERHNHSLLVTQRHTATLYGLASSVSRAADAEWTRVCDSVRKSAPIIGRIGECRAYLEGAWMSNVPDVSGDPDDSNHVEADAGAREQDASGAVDEMGVRVAKFPSGSTETDSSHRSLAPAFASSTSLNSASPPSSVPSYQTSQGPPSAPPSLPSRSHSTGPPPTSFSPAQLDRTNMDSVRSIESLSSFPAPPAHFPLPPMAHLPVPRHMPPTSDDKRTPQADGDKAGPDETGDVRNMPNLQVSNTLNAPAVSAEQSASRPVDDASPSGGNSSGQLLTPAASPGTDKESLDEDDETVKIRPMERPQSPQRRGSGNTSPGADELGSSGRKVSRSESIVSTSSIVASMRDKFGRGDAVSAAPPRERDMPKVPNKVSDLASKYATTTDATPVPLSPRNTAFVFPSSDRSRQVSGSSAKGDEKAGSMQGKQDTKASSTDPGVTPSELNILRRRRRLEELEDLERREQAQVLRAREREIEMQTKELERERDRLLALRVADSTGLVDAVPVRAHPPHSHSMVNLVPSYSGAGEASVRPVSQHGEPLALASSRPTDHAPYCGCQSCSASQYRDPHPHVQVIAQARAQKEKSKSWMRRLSMPVVANAFSSDPKKSYNVGSGIAGGPQAPGQLPYFEKDSTGGISNIRPRKISFGRR